VIKPVEVLTADLAEYPASGGGEAGPTTGTERIFADVLAGVLHTERVPVGSHFFDDLGADSLVMAQFCARVRKRGDLPSVSMKDIYQHPTISSLAAALTVAALSPVERTFAEVLAGVLHTERVPVGSHFFDDLGADSLVMAQFCARVRKRGDLPSVSMKDIYQHPTISSLATAFTDVAPTPVASASASVASLTGPVSASAPVEVAEPVSVARRVGTLRYLLCGALQLLAFLGYSYAAAQVAARGYEWISGGSGLADIYLRTVLVGGAGFLAVGCLPILAKWVLIGRWKPRQIPIWSLTYVRFWIVKTLVRWNPLALLLVGSPLYVLYLRALGAHIGRGVAIFSKNVPICTDLLTIGEGAVIRKDAFFTCYRAHAGQIQTGTVTLGRDVVVGEKTVLDINTSMGDGAQLGHASALYSGQSVPDGERWHGSPAQRTDVNYLRVSPADCGTWRRFSSSVVTLLQLFLLLVPLVEGGLYMLLTSVPSLAKILAPGVGTVTSGAVFLDGLELSLALFLGSLFVGLLFVATVPRVLNRFIEPDKVYPLYGFHHGVHRSIARLTNAKFFTFLFGDSSYITHYLRWVGYDLPDVVQTGSNFGMEVAHESPYLSTVGSGTMVADGLSIMNAEFSSTSFRVSRVSIGRDNFLGNHIAYPPGGRTGDNCLLATKVMIPLDGKIRQGVGLLGSPPFEIPRSVERDSKFDHLRTEDELHRHLAAKNRYDVRSMGVYLFARWLHVFLITTIGLAAVDFYDVLSHVVMAAFLVLNVVVSALFFILVERCFTAFRPLQPKYCSIYDPYFWRHERLWKVPADSYLHFFDGTPFKNVIWRMLGVQIGKRVFDDGCYVTERTLAAIGDDATLNTGSKVQCHSQEDGTFKADRITIGSGCTLGVGAMVHYGVTMGDGSVLAADSFLMKGEEIPPDAFWGGNPATELEPEIRQSVPHEPPAVPDELPPQAHVAPADSQTQLDPKLVARLGRLGEDIRALQADGERTMSTLDRQEASLAQLRSSIKQFTADQDSITGLVQGGTTNVGR
jgi:non-ribosomal peptide synthetase-like protein